MQSRWQGGLALAAAVGAIFSGLYAPAQQTGGAGGVPGGDTVTSVFNRTGAVAAGNGDYTAAQVTNAAAVNAVNTFTANQIISNGDTLQFPLANNDTVVLGNVLGAIEGTDTMTNRFIFSAGGADGGAYFGISTASPLLWLDPAPVPQNVEAGLTWVKAGTLSVDHQGDGSGDGWLMVSAIGSGASGNTDLRGHIALSAGAGSYTFSRTYTTAPTCVATDTTTAAPIKVTVTTTALTLTGTGSDILNYICAD